MATGSCFILTLLIIMNDLTLQNDVLFHRWCLKLIGFFFSNKLPSIKRQMHVFFYTNVYSSRINSYQCYLVMTDFRSCFISYFSWYQSNFYFYLKFHICSWRRWPGTDDFSLKWERECCINLYVLDSVHLYYNICIKTDNLFKKLS